MPPATVLGLWLWGTLDPARWRRALLGSLCLALACLTYPPARLAEMGEAGRMVGSVARRAGEATAGVLGRGFAGFEIALDDGP